MFSAEISVTYGDPQLYGLPGNYPVPYPIFFKNYYQRSCCCINSPLCYSRKGKPIGNQLFQYVYIYIVVGVRFELAPNDPCAGNGTVCQRLWCVRLLAIRVGNRLRFHAQVQVLPTTLFVKVSVRRAAGQNAASRLPEVLSLVTAAQYASQHGYTYQSV